MFKGEPNPCIWRINTNVNMEGVQVFPDQTKKIGGEAWTLATWPAECFKPPSLQPVDHPLLAPQGWVSSILHRAFHMYL